MNGGLELAIKKQASKWKHEINDVLLGKVEEFQLLDYSKATSEDVWNCLMQKVWKGDPEKALHEVVQDIYHLSPGLYMTYLTQQSLMVDELQESIDALLGYEQENNE